MSIRTTETTIAFEHPFKLSSLDGVQPPGTYRVSIDEEEISGMSFVGFRRVATAFHLPAINSAGNSVEVFQIDPSELAAALARDQQTKA